MKNYIKLSILLFSLLVKNNIIFSQENPQNLNDFKHQNAINLQLQKHGIDMYPVPASDPCLRQGKPPLLRDLPFLPGDILPADSIVVDTTLTLGSSSLGKTAGDVNIFWIHGLNGTTETWSIAAKATEYGVYEGSQIVFSPRKANSICGVSSSTTVQLYSENGTITTAMQCVEDYMEIALPTINRTEKDFIIAHSQGGIVGREWLRHNELLPGKYKNFAHGLVTFGTPHDGAQIINNTHPDLGNKVPNFMKQGCESLAGAIIKPIVNSNFLTRLLISNDMQAKLINSTCAFAANSIIPFALDNYYKGTTADYYKGAEFLTGYKDGIHTKQGLSEYTLKVPVVQFYGIEETPVLWKFMSSTMALGHDKLDSREKIFGYTKDDQLEKKVNAMINEFDAGYNYESGEEDKYYKIEIASLASSLLFLPIASYIWAMDKKNKAIENKNAYHSAKVWLTNANDYYLTEIVGARVSTTTLNCRVVGNIDCRDNRYNAVGSGVPPVNVGIDYNFNTTNSYCSVPPVNITYTDYHFKGHNGTEWHGPCTGSLTVIPAYKLTYSYKDNDGVVLAESAAKWINVDPNYSHKLVALPKTNHDQMKNSTVTKDELNNLYDGKHGPFFYIQPN